MEVREFSKIRIIEELFERWGARDLLWTYKNRGRRNWSSLSKNHILKKGPRVA